MLARSLAERLGLATGMQTMTRMTFATSASEIITEKHESARLVTLNRPKALNALNLNMVRELYPLLKNWDASKKVSIVVVKGAGEKAFCAGGDVLAVTTAAKAAKTGGTDTIHKDFFREEYQLNHLIGTFSKPYVAIIDGITMGGGCGLSVNGRFRVATEKTMLSMPETALGLFPDVGGSYFLSRLKNNLGIFLALTGFRLLGADAWHSGLATHYVRSADVPELEKKLLTLEKPTDKDVEALIRSFQPKEVPAFTLAEKLPTIRETFHVKSIEDLCANLEKEGSEFSLKQLKTITKMSPTSLKVTLKQLDKGARMSYSKVFTMEYRLTQRFMEDHDFHEGCRAILIDKDRNPKWKPATLAEVSDAHVDSYFAPLPHPQELLLHDD